MNFVKKIFEIEIDKKTYTSFVIRMVIKTLKQEQFIEDDKVSICEYLNGDNPEEIKYIISILKEQY